MYVYKRNIAPIKTRKTATVIAITEPVGTEGEVLFEDDEEDVFGVGLDVEVTPGSVVSRSDTEFVDEPEAPSNKLDTGGWSSRIGYRYLTSDRRFVHGGMLRKSKGMCV
jgi:hypothetical protein